MGGYELGIWVGKAGVGRDKTRRDDVRDYIVRCV